MKVPFDGHLKWPAWTHICDRSMRIQTHPPNSGVSCLHRGTITWEPHNFRARNTSKNWQTVLRECTAHIAKNRPRLHQCRNKLVFLRMWTSLCFPHCYRLIPMPCEYQVIVICLIQKQVFYRPLDWRWGFKPNTQAGTQSSHVSEGLNAYLER